jgi:hypothetical protein
VDGRVAGRLERSNPRNLTLPAAAAGNQDAVLDILVEALGRVNFGCDPAWDYKGLTSPDVRLNGAPPARRRHALCTEASQTRRIILHQVKTRHRDLTMLQSCSVLATVHDQMHTQTDTTLNRHRGAVFSRITLCRASPCCSAERPAAAPRRRAARSQPKAPQQAAKEAAAAGLRQAEALQQALEALVLAQESQVGVRAQLVPILVARFQAAGERGEALACLAQARVAARDVEERGLALTLRDQLRLVPAPRAVVCWFSPHTLTVPSTVSMGRHRLTMPMPIQRCGGVKCT